MKIIKRSTCVLILFFSLFSMIYTNTIYAKSKNQDSNKKIIIASAAGGATVLVVAGSIYYFYYSGSDIKVVKITKKKPKRGGDDFLGNDNDGNGGDDDNDKDDGKDNGNNKPGDHHKKENNRDKDGFYIREMKKAIKKSKSEVPNDGNSDLNDASGEYYEYNGFDINANPIDLIALDNHNLGIAIRKNLRINNVPNNDNTPEDTNGISADTVRLQGIFLDNEEDVVEMVIEESMDGHVEENENHDNFFLVNPENQVYELVNPRNGESYDEALLRVELENNRRRQPNTMDPGEKQFFLDFEKNGHFNI